MTPAPAPRRFELDDPDPGLRWLASQPDSVELSAIDVAEVWALVAMATQGRLDGAAPLRLHPGQTSNTGRFASAVGFEDALQGHPSRPASEASRTFPLTRIDQRTETEPIADNIARRIVVGNEHDDARKSTYYVLNELLRNVLQHSRDRLGGIVAAQRNEGGRNSQRPFIQVAVADGGIGIQESLLPLHRALTDPREALVKALEPHISGTFEEGESGSAQNAGMGLFFISEMTKLVGGRLLVASRGASLVLEGTPGAEEGESHHLRFLDRGLGFNGTLVAFEMPEEEQAYDDMMETIRAKAKERTPKRATHQWLKFEEPPPEAQRLMIQAIRESSTKAAEMGGRISQRLMEGKPVALDFTGIAVSTQSFLHALLYQALRLAWALKVPIYVVHADPAVRSTLELVENYALGG